MSTAERCEQHRNNPFHRLLSLALTIYGIQGLYRLNIIGAAGFTSRNKDWLFSHTRADLQLQVEGLEAAAVLRTT